MAITEIIPEFDESKIPEEGQSPATIETNGFYMWGRIIEVIKSLNVFRNQVNITQNEMNILKTQTENVNTTASADAAIATQKASEANNSANQALTYYNLLKGYVIPPGASYSIDQINTQNSAMTKAQFNALAEERKASRAGSGFEEWGKHHATIATYPNVNEGMYVYPNVPNIFNLGRQSSSGAGISKTELPILNINGVRTVLKSVGTGSNFENTITLPTAPTIYPYDTVLTAEQIASGVIKHADASNSGLVVMGKNLSGTTFNQTVLVVNGKKYIIEYKDNGVRKTLEITASSTSYIISLTGTNITEVGMYPADAISRQDFVFIKQNIENIATKDFFVPLGNKQYLGGDVDGITGISVGAFSGATTSSLFGTWQVAGALVGKGYVWSTRTEAQKKALLANPENNAYLDGADIYQATYMVKVTNLPNDNYTESTAFAYVGYTQDSIDKGLWTPSDGSKTVSVALISRRNQGMWHHVYNPNGTKLASDSLNSYKTAVSFTSISDCFDPTKLLAASGYIGSVSGRPDGLFYDQVHESDITDLRNSSKKPEDYNRLISREFNKLVAGTNRGKEGEYRYLKAINTAGSGTKNNINILKTSIQNGIDIVNFNAIGGVEHNGQYAKVMYIFNGSTEISLILDRNITVVNGSEVYFSATSTRTKSNTLLHCDIIGNPTNYPTSWKESGVFGTPLIVAEDGTSLLPDGAKDSFKLSRKANATPLLCLRSTDNGATWTSFTPTFSIPTNAITLTDEPAGNLVVVYYQTHTSMAVPVTNSEVLEIGDVFATTHYVGTYGGYLSNTLISKSPTSSGATRRFNYYKLNNCPMQPIPIRVIMTGTGVEPPSHIDANLLYIDNTPAIKVFPYLTRLNGKAYLNLVFKEMKHNGTSWGDDGKFNIVDNISTTTDNNAQTVLIGQKTVELPYFIDAGE